MHWPDDLIVVNPLGMPVNQYRVADGELRFRNLHGHSAGAWRTLTYQDVLMHCALKTEVAEWLYARRGLTDGRVLKTAFQLKPAS